MELNRFKNINETSEIVSLSKSTIVLWESQGRFPKAVRLSKKKFQFQLAPTAVSEALTGFGHNSVSPFGLKTPIPVIVCRRCAELSPPFLMLGGGEVYVKLSLPVADLIRGCCAVVGDISDLRVEGDQQFTDETD